MKTLHLTEYLKSNSQSAAAASMGVTQGAVSQMVANGRNIFFEVSDNGEIVDFWERKKPRSKKAS